MLEAVGRIFSEVVIRIARRVSSQSIARSALDLVGLLIAVVLLYQVYLFTWVLWYSVFNPGGSAYMRSQASQLAALDPPLSVHYQWVPYEAISPSLKKAVIAAEDARFTEHGGVEWEAIRKAWRYNERQEQAGRSRRRGGSTLTQQLAKNLFLSADRNYVRKGQELIITYMIEAVMSKRRILELYLNVVEYGNGIFGAQAAARHYFDVDAKRLSVSQAARLAAVLPNPKVYGKNMQSRYVLSRSRTISARMRSAVPPK
ncbi:monofunctional biosynthetic peptidoglycan transglycosylase [Advenella sp. S44]|uniref:monofunctional biosynthetic peptidoglycan transglycosylase n=1 Tax=Advenella sp. S44 TaxID=1982755 RepID=UPI000C29B155|nr:monofunctional biosynthetic peptidoglycan transglycosylase [Advenella sp. S44]PJX25755.1 monofunctional biosynthetic peptidoglycan transglycosylase [Advenella sp. S44]